MQRLAYAFARLQDAGPWRTWSRVLLIRLADLLRAARLRAEREALAAQRALTHELEGLVAQRPQALEGASRRLAEISITDELTGVFNRRRFNAALQAEAARHQRSRTPLALCLFDIDRFKLYNDRYGHPAGDAVLREVAQAVRGRAGRNRMAMHEA